MDPFDEISLSRAAIVATTVDGLYTRHPEWASKWGEAGRASCARDVAFTLAFTEAAVRMDDEEVVTEYARWLSGLLRARHVPIESARESFSVLAQALAGELSRDLSERTKAALAAAADALDRPDPIAADPPLAPLTADFVAALLKPDRASIRDILDGATTGGMTSSAIADELIRPAMTEIGARWARNEVSVAEEHRATALALHALARTAPPRTTKMRGTMVLACVEGNLHSLGAGVVAAAFEADGWNVEYLGADVPTRDLIDFVRDRDVDLVGLSVTLPLHLTTARRMVDTLRRELGPDCPRIVVGGKTVHEFARSARFISADALFTDAASGVTASRRSERAP